MAKVEIEDTELAELRKLAGAATKNHALAEALQGELKTAKEQAARVPTLEAEVATHKAAQVESTFTGAGITDAKVRKVFQLEYEEQAASPTGEKDLGKWLSGLQGMKPEERPAHLAPFIRSDAGGAGQGLGDRAGRRDGPPPRVDANTRTVDGAKPAITADQIAAMSPEEFRTALPRLAQTDPQFAQMASILGIKAEAAA